jgi:hypothetical protein
VLYYILNQNQGEIAAGLEISSSKASRLIKEARKKWIVEIRGRMPIPRDMELEQELLERVSAGSSIGVAWGMVFMPPSVRCRTTTRRILRYRIARRFAADVASIEEEYLHGKAYCPGL